MKVKVADGVHFRDSSVGDGENKYVEASKPGGLVTAVTARQWPPDKLADLTDESDAVLLSSARKHCASRTPIRLTVKTIMA